VGDQISVVEAKATLQSTQSTAVNIGVARAQDEHAIALLLGKPASEFSLPIRPIITAPPPIPIGVPPGMVDRSVEIPTPFCVERSRAQSLLDYLYSSSNELQSQRNEKTNSITARNSAEYLVLGNRNLLARAASFLLDEGPMAPSLEVAIRVLLKTPKSDRVEARRQPRRQPTPKPCMTNGLDPSDLCALLFATRHDCSGTTESPRESHP
jgi:hypothetical protein